MTALAPQPDAYQAFLESKIRLAEAAGFDVEPSEINPALKPHIRVAVRWALAGGRRALFSRFGTQKTTWHLEIARLVMTRTGRAPLIIMPLGARLSFLHDAAAWFKGPFAIRLKFIKSDAEIDPDAINLTNTESIREEKVDPRKFSAVLFDEADILRNMNTKTFWAFTRLAKEVPYRFVGTATPDPRDYTELLAFAGYLDIMDVGQARTRFFKRDSEKADKLTIHPHKEKEFWLWVASWGLFINKPSDVDPAFCDDGYVLPGLDIRWHEVPTDLADAGVEKSGQFRLIKDSARGVQDASREKRDSLPARVAKMMALRAEDPAAHRLLWHDLEAERAAIEAAVPGAVTVYGAQDLGPRERALIDFAEGRIQELAGKPVMIGSGPNFQFHCWWAIFLGIGFKFKDVIQAVHRIQRYGQAFAGHKGDRPCVRLDFIYTEAERETRRLLEQNWARYEAQAARMAGLIREYGLAQVALGAALKRSMGVARAEVRGERFVAANNDCVLETKRIATDSVGLVLTSLPFSTQYEYTPNFCDFGHTDDDPHFFRQMDFLTPELLRVLKPGRVLAVHCKDRIVEGARSGLGFQTVAPFGARTLFHFIEHGFAYLGTKTIITDVGFAYLGTKTIITDVVRENNQTYRLGWTEQCKDGSRMGFGLPEYLHVFRKPQSDRSRGYADEPVVKSKAIYTRARWQLDAAGFGRSSGDRLLTAAELAGLPPRGVFHRWRAHSTAWVYDFGHHVACAEALDAANKLPPDFGIVPAHSWHPDVWTDVVRMRSLNSLQQGAGREKHLCPLPFDIVDRAIAQYSMEDELVLDPFGGLMTVPYCALRQKRRGYGIELNADYFRDGVRYLQAAEAEASVPAMFDLLGEGESSSAQAASAGAAIGAEVAP